MILILCLIKDNGILSEVFMWVPWCWERLKQEEKEATEDEMVGWHHRLNGHEFEQTPGDTEGQRSLACYSPWCCKELDAAESMNNNSPQFQLSSLLRTVLRIPFGAWWNRNVSWALGCTVHQKCACFLWTSYLQIGDDNLQVVVKLKKMICECIWCIICA